MNEFQLALRKLAISALNEELIKQQVFIVFDEKLELYSAHKILRSTQYGNVTKELITDTCSLDSLIVQLSELDSEYLSFEEYTNN